MLPTTRAGAAAWRPSGRAASEGRSSQPTEEEAVARTYEKIGLDAGMTRAMPDGAKLSSENYRTFRRRLQIFQKMCARRGPSTIAEGALSLLASFEGDLFDKLETIPLDDLEQPTAFTEILRILDMHFQYSIEVQQPENIEKFVQDFRRLKGEPLNQFLLRHQQEVR